MTASDVDAAGMLRRSGPLPPDMGRIDDSRSTRSALEGTRGRRESVTPSPLPLYERPGIRLAENQQMPRTKKQPPSTSRVLLLATNRATLEDLGDYFAAAGVATHAASALN